MLRRRSLDRTDSSPSGGWRRATDTTTRRRAWWRTALTPFREDAAGAAYSSYLVTTVAINYYFAALQRLGLSVANTTRALNQDPIVWISRPRPRLFRQALQLEFRGSTFEGVECTGVARLVQQTGGLVNVMAKHGVLADKKVRLAALVPWHVRTTVPRGAHHFVGVDASEIIRQDRPGPGLRVDHSGIAC